MTTLSDELNKLRNNICHDCKKRLVPGSVSTPVPSTGPNPSTAASSTSAPFWRALFKGRLPIRPPSENAGSGDTFNSETSNSIPNISLTAPETIFDPPVDTPVDSEQTPISFPEPESQRPDFSVVYNLEVERTLDLRLARIFTHDSPFCMKMSPDGQRIAVGVLSLGKTVINDVKTGSNVRSVSECLVRNLA